MPDGVDDRLFSDDAALAAIAEGEHTLYVEAADSPATGGVTHASWGDINGAGAWTRLFRNANRAQALYSDGTLSDTTNGAVIADATYWLNPHWMYQQVSATLVTVGAYQDTPVSVALTASPAGVDRFAIGARVIGGTTGFADFTAEELGHIIVFARALSAAHHADIQSWLEARWPAP